MVSMHHSVPNVPRDLAWAAIQDGEKLTYCPAATWSKGTRSSLPSCGGVFRLSGFEEDMLMVNHAGAGPFTASRMEQAASQSKRAQEEAGTVRGGQG